MVYDSHQVFIWKQSYHVLSVNFFCGIAVSQEEEQTHYEEFFEDVFIELEEVGMIFFTWAIVG